LRKRASAECKTPAGAITGAEPRASAQEPLIAGVLVVGNAGVVAFGSTLTLEAFGRLRRIRAFDEGCFDRALRLHLERVLPQAVAIDQELRP